MQRPVMLTDMLAVLHLIAYCLCIHFRPKASAHR